MRAPLLLRILNAASGAQPVWTWKRAPLLRMRERIAGTVQAGRGSSDATRSHELASG